MDTWDWISQAGKGIDLRYALPLALLLLATLGCTFYLSLYLVAPVPRQPFKSEKTFTCVGIDGKPRPVESLPCWQDEWYKKKEFRNRGGDPSQTGIGIEEPSVYMSLVVPAFNEEARLHSMLVEATDYLKQKYSDHSTSAGANGSVKRRKGYQNGLSNGHIPGEDVQVQGWEVLIVSDGSTDQTVETALRCARELEKDDRSSIRVIQLERNRGKGGAVTHGLRHVRGRYALFADADGASRFEDLGKLVSECEEIEDEKGRGVAIGSRAHLVGSEAVVKRSFLRNFLMHSFHFLLRLLTPPATAAIRDTQCGFKLFSRASLPYIVPYMHSEGWIFDVEMLMLAESANIPVVEVPVGWHEVTGSKLNVIWDSLSMAWGLAVLRAAWGTGIYKRS